MRFSGSPIMYLSDRVQQVKFNLAGGLFWGVSPKAVPWDPYLCEQYAFAGTAWVTSVVC